MSHATARGLANAIIEAANRAAAALAPLSAQHPTITLGVHVPAEVLDALAELTCGERRSTCWLDSTPPEVIESVRWECAGVALSAQGVRTALTEDVAQGARRYRGCEDVSPEEARAAIGAPELAGDKFGSAPTTNRSASQPTF